MARPQLALATAKEAVNLVNSLLKSGFTLKGRPSAITEAADRLETSPSTIKYRIDAAARLYRLTLDTTTQTERTAAHRKITDLEDQVRGLKASVRAAHRASLNDENIREILGVMAKGPASPPNWTHTIAKRTGKLPEVPVTSWADWHLGEVVNKDEVNGVNEYNIKIAESRVNHLVDNTISLCTKHHSGNYPGVVVNLLGDFVSGGLHPELAKTDELENISASLKARDLLVAGLTKMANTFGKVYVPCVAGNHGRNTHKPEFKRYVYKNFDWLIYQLLIRHFEGDDRLQFDVRSSNDVHYRVYGIRYLAVHGDMLGVKGGDGIIGAIGPIMRGEFKKSNQSASTGQEYDVLLMGHWHQQLWLPKAIVANSLKGFDEYARLQLGARPTRPSQPLWFVHPTRGMTSHWEVWVDEPTETNKEWISWHTK